MLWAGIYFFLCGLGGCFGGGKAGGENGGKDRGIVYSLCEFYFTQCAVCAHIRLRVRVWGEAPHTVHAARQQGKGANWLRIASKRLPCGCTYNAKVCAAVLLTLLVAESASFVVTDVN